MIAPAAIHEGKQRRYILVDCLNSKHTFVNIFCSTQLSLFLCVCLVFHENEKDGDDDDEYDYANDDDEDDE